MNSTILKIGALSLVLAGCSAADTRTAAESEGEPASAAEPTEWTATTNSGLTVTLRPQATPVSLGAAHLHVTFADEVADPARLSLDLVSPDMPMMGVRRFPLTPHEDGFMAMVDFPMAGLWNVYVNVGEGTDAARFELDVRPGADGSEHAHGGVPSDAPMDMDAEDHAGSGHSH